MSLYRNINKRKKAGTSRSKKNSTISHKAYANMKAGFPKKKKKKNSMKNQKHYKKDGTLFAGNTHKMPNGDLHSNKSHTKTSVKLYHFKDLSKKAKLKAKRSI